MFFVDFIVFFHFCPLMHRLHMEVDREVLWVQRGCFILQDFLDGKGLATCTCGMVLQACNHQGRCKDMRLEASESRRVFLHLPSSSLSLPAFFIFSKASSLQDLGDICLPIFAPTYFLRLAVKQSWAWGQSEDTVFETPLGSANFVFCSQSTSFWIPFWYVAFLKKNGHVWYVGVSATRTYHVLFDM